MKQVRWMVYGMLATLGCALAGGVVLMYSGLYDVGVASGHSALVHWALEQGMRSSVRRHALGLQAPPVEAAMLVKGARCFDMHCVQCHGAPGTSPQAVGKALLPNAKSLVQSAHDWPLEHIYWITRHGVRMTGMPSWELRMGERELWAVAAFVDQELPRLTVQQYRERMAAAGAERCEAPQTRAVPDARRGLLAIRQYGCHGCHIIPGVVGPQVHVGPALKDFARRPLLAGVLPNTPENVVRWLRGPHVLRPRTQMPDLGVTEQHARDIHAYLATLD